MKYVHLQPFVFDQMLLLCLKKPKLDSIQITVANVLI